MAAFRDDDNIAKRRSSDRAVAFLLFVEVVLLLALAWAWGHGIL